MIVTRVEGIRAAAPAGDGKILVHAYDLEASFEGAIDPESGMVVNLQALKERMRSRVVGRVQDRMLDGREGRPEARTAEALARFAWRELDGAIDGVRLVRVRLDGRPRIVVECTGGKGVPMDVTRIYEFSAAHRLHGRGLTDDENRALFGKCNNPEGHGHNYVLEVTWRGQPGDEGELVPADIVDRIVGAEVADRWDHKNLNRDLPEFDGVNPTAEEIVRIAWDRLARGFAGKLPTGVRLHRLKLLETARNHVETTGE